jgi:pyruvate/2-oxoglutarate dehydrogenase complex dihydrolipoamide dehydrogenase (E3) component
MNRRRLKADLVIIGAGSGGLSVAAGAAQLGLKVVLFEKGEMGGDCLNAGCVPSKALIAAANQVHARHQHGGAPAQEADFIAAMAQVQSAVNAVAPHDSQARFEGLGVTVVREVARFTGRRTVESDSKFVTARTIVLAAGSRPAVPDIPGLSSIPFLTNESVFRLETRPRRLLILGGGPIGLELGQAFRRLGSEVVIIERGQSLQREDEDLALHVRDQVVRDGVTIVEGAEAVRFEPAPHGVVVGVERRGNMERWEGTHLLVAVGRAPDLGGLNLEAAGIAHDRSGVRTDRQLKTTNRSVYAIGDIAGRGQFTHLAGAHAALVVRRALFAQPVDVTGLVVPRVTYTDPELAVVGLGEKAARAKYGGKVEVIHQSFDDDDRALAERDTRGAAKLILYRGRILGVGIVGAHAGDLLQPWTLAMTAGVKLRSIASMIAPYPTRGEINRKLASSHFTPLLFSEKSRALVALLKHFG